MRLYAVKYDGWYLVQTKMSRRQGEIKMFGRDKKHGLPFLASNIPIQLRHSFLSFCSAY